MKNIKMSDAIVFALALVAMMFALAGCSSGPNADNSSSVKASPTDTTLVIGFDPKYPPYGFVAADGSYVGFDIDLAAAVADANGWSFEAKPIDWAKRDDELESGNVNCIWNGFTMEGREGLYTFSEPYMLNEQVIVVKAHGSIDSLDDLAGKKVITQSGSAALEVLSGPRADLAATFDGGAPMTTTSFDDAFLQLDSGKADAVACDLSIASYQMSQSGDKYSKVDEALSLEHYAVGFKLGDEKFAKTVTNTLKVLYEEGVVEELCKKYSAYGVSFTNWVLK